VTGGEDYFSSTPIREAFVSERDVTENRQPVHTVFGGAHLFRADVIERFRALATASMDTYAGDPGEFREAFGIASPELAERVYVRVREKLQREPIEDYRIDFEDGYGTRDDSEEDAHAVSAAVEVAAAMAAGALPWRVGIRVKSFGESERVRSERTLRLFLKTLIDAAGRLPEWFIVNLPKVSTVAEVEEFDRLLSVCESEYHLKASIGLEVMVETPGIVLARDGRSPLPDLLKVGKTRVDGAIFGAYDFTSALGIAASQQSLRHPTCDFARNMMLVAFAGSWVQLSDGATAVIPVPVHAAPNGGALTPAQRDENRRGVHAAWRVHRDNVRHAMSCGFYQGWDLHPAQLVSRYAATYEFFIEGLEPAAARVRNFLAKSAQATRVGTAFDDMATVLGLGNHFRRARNAGAITQAEMDALLGFSAQLVKTYAVESS
jgi:citrate lyase beta subunit